MYTGYVSLIYRTDAAKYGNLIGSARPQAERFYGKRVQQRGGLVVKWLKEFV